MTMTTGHGSFPNMAWWGYDKNETQFKTPAACIRMLVDVVSKGGNLLLNVGPDATGRIGPHEIAAFEAMGQWLKVNGPAVYGTTAGPFKHLSFDGRATAKANMLYLHVFAWPPNRRLIVPGLLNSIRSARLLAGGTSLNVVRADSDWVIALPDAAPDPVDSVIALELEGEPRVEPYRIRPDAQERIVLEAIDAEMPLDPGLHFRLEESAGKVHIGRWVSMKDVAAWSFNLAQPGTYDVAVEYAAEAGNPAGAFEVELVSAGGTPVKLPHEVQPTGGPEHFQVHALGRCTLAAGPVAVSIRPVRLPKNVYLMSLRQTILTPTEKTP